MTCKEKDLALPKMSLLHQIIIILISAYSRADFARKHYGKQTQTFYFLNNNYLIFSYYFLSFSCLASQSLFSSHLRYKDSINLLQVIGKYADLVITGAYCFS